MEKGRPGTGRAAGPGHARLQGAGGTSPRKDSAGRSRTPAPKVAAVGAPGDAGRGCPAEIREYCRFSPDTALWACTRANPAWQLF